MRRFAEGALMISKGGNLTTQKHNAIEDVSARNDGFVLGFFGSWFNHMRMLLMIPTLACF